MSATYTIGDGKTYTGDIQDAIDDIPGGLSAQGKQWVQVYAKAAGYAEVLDLVWGFANSSAADYVDVEAMVSHSGLRGHGIVLDCGSAATNYWINFGYTIGNVPYARFHGFCVTASTHKAGVTNYVFPIGSDYCSIYDNIVYDCQSDAGKEMKVVYSGAGAGKGLFLANNQFFNIGNVTGDAYVIQTSEPGTAGSEVKIINNVLYNFSVQGLRGQNIAYMLCHNNYIAGGSCYALLGGANCSITHNISSDATADDWGGVGNLINKAAADQFVSVTPGAEDFHLKSTADCFRNGADMSQYFTHDCVNIPRKFWRTGAFETLPKVYSVNDGKPHSVYYSWGGNLAKVDGVDVPLRNTETMTSNDDASIQVGQHSTGVQFGGLIGDLKIYDQPDVKVTR